MFLFGLGIGLSFIILARRYKSNSSSSGEGVAGWSVVIMLLATICLLIQRCDPNVLKGL